MTDENLILPTPERSLCLVFRLQIHRNASQSVLTPYLASILDNHACDSPKTLITMPTLSTNKTYGILAWGLLQLIPSFLIFP